MDDVLESAAEKGILGSSVEGIDLALSAEEDIWDSSEGEGVLDPSMEEDLLESAVEEGRGVA